MTDRIEVIQGDITRFAGDAIVNAANSSLLGGGGVDSAIHRAAGPQLLAACRQIGGCPTGGARITPGFDLPASWVIHTVGPIWSGGNRDEDRLLARCYQSSLHLAAEHGVQTIAFPAISTGIYGFPLERATRIAVAEVRDYLAAHALPREVTFVCFGGEACRTYRAVVDELTRRS